MFQAEQLSKGKGSEMWDTQGGQLGRNTVGRGVQRGGGTQTVSSLRGPGRDFGFFSKKGSAAGFGAEDCHAMTFSQVGSLGMLHSDQTRGESKWKQGNPEVISFVQVRDDSHVDQSGRSGGDEKLSDSRSTLKVEPRYCC